MLAQADDIYPNLFIGLIGPPGNGKSYAATQCGRFWRGTNILKVAPDKMTGPALIDEMAECSRTVAMPGRFVTYHSLQVAADELSSLIPAYDMGFMGLMNKMYDCATIEERLRTRKNQKIVIPNTQVTFIGGGQPDYLAAVMPAHAWGQGFLSRFIFVYAGIRKRQDPFEDDGRRFETAKQAVSEDLDQVLSLNGFVRWSEEAKAACRKWQADGELPKITHPRLEHYASRRLIYLAKLSMISSISRGNSNIIELGDWQRAHTWISEAEATVPSIFRTTGVAGDGMLLYDTWLRCWDQFQEHGRAIAERHIAQFIAQRIGAMSVTKAIDNMILGGMLMKCGGDQRPGMSTYIPQPKESWDDSMQALTQGDGREDDRDAREDRGDERDDQ